MPAGGKIGNKGGGRKTRGEELALVEWYKALLPETFSIAEEMLRSKNKKDRLWAMDWLKAGLVKMIPQTLKGDEKNPLFAIPIYAGLSKHNGNQENIPAKQEN